MVMTSVSGHLLNNDFTGGYKGWKSCNPLSLFDAPVIKFCSKDYEPIKVSYIIITKFHSYKFSGTFCISCKH